MPQLWCRSQVWLEFDPWPRNFHMQWVQPKKKKKEPQNEGIFPPVKSKFFFVFFRVAPATYGGSQARGQTGAVATGLCHNIAMLGLSCICDLQHSSWQRQILNPLSEARDGTCVLMDANHIPFC